MSRRRSDFAVGRAGSRCWVLLFGIVTATVAVTALTLAEPVAIACPSMLGHGIDTDRDFCDVLTGRDPAGGVVVTIPRPKPMHFEDQVVVETLRNHIFPTTT